MPEMVEVPVIEDVVPEGNHFRLSVTGPLEDGALPMPFAVRVRASGARVELIENTYQRAAALHASGSLQVPLQQPATIALAFDVSLDDIDPTPLTRAELLNDLESVWLPKPWSEANTWRVKRDSAGEPVALEVSTDAAGWSALMSERPSLTMTVAGRSVGSSSRAPWTST